MSPAQQMIILHTAEECRQKVKDLIAEAVREADNTRREGLLGMADQWMEASRRRTDPALFSPGRGRSASPPGW